MKPPRHEPYADRVARELRVRQSCPHLLSEHLWGPRESRDAFQMHRDQQRLHRLRAWRRAGQLMAFFIVSAALTLLLVDRCIGGPRHGDAQRPFLTRSAR